MISRQLRCAVAIAGILATSLLAPETSSAGGGICAEVPGPRPGCIERPHVMFYGAHASIYGLKWSHWGSNRAIGRGHILWRRTATEPSFGPYAVKLIFSVPAECGHRNRYAYWTLKIKRRRAWQTSARDEPLGSCFS